MNRLAHRIFVALCLATGLFLGTSYFFVIDVDIANRRQMADRLVSLNLYCGTAHLGSSQTLRAFDPDAGLCQVAAKWNFLPAEIFKGFVDFHVGHDDLANGDHNNWIEFPAYAAMLPLLVVAVFLSRRLRNQRSAARCFPVVR